jgi:hypothetical protein
MQVASRAGPPGHGKRTEPTSGRGTSDSPEVYCADEGLRSNPGGLGLAFNTYHSIIDVVHGKAYSKLTHAILGFVRQVLELSEVYDWQSQVLPMALEHHRLVMAKGVTNAETWPLPAATRDRYCNHLMVTVPLSKKRSSDGIRVPKSASQSTTTCNNWNNGICSYENCRRIHACSKCGDTLHTALKCKK